MRALVIWTVTVMASACGEGVEREGGGVSSSTGPARGDVSGRSAGRVVRFMPTTPRPSNAFTFDVRLDAGEREAEDAGSDTDAGADPQIAEFERAIVYDCTETLQCMGPANNIPGCVVRVRQALNAASSETRQVFMQHVMRCRPQQACGYVQCVTAKAP